MWRARSSAWIQYWTAWRRCSGRPPLARWGHNLNFMLTSLSNYGVRPPSVDVAFDTMIAAHLVGEKALGLKQLAFNRLNVELQALSDLVGTGRKQIGFDAVPIDAGGKVRG